MRRVVFVTVKEGQCLAFLLEHPPYSTRNSLALIILRLLVRFRGKHKDQARVLEKKYKSLAP